MSSAPLQPLQLIHANNLINTDVAAMAGSHTNSTLCGAFYRRDSAKWGGLGPATCVGLVAGEVW